MRPNISNCHALPGMLIIMEWADGSGKTTQIKALTKLLEKEWRKVTISSWKSSPIIGDFMESNDALKKMDLRILPETSLFMQAADLLYRIELEVIPALKKNHVVILDRGLHTLLVRGLMLGMNDYQLRHGLLWWRNTVYKELFDNAVTVEISIELEESLQRIKGRAMHERPEVAEAEKKGEWTLLALDFINSLVYSAEGKKMTKNDKRAFIRKTQGSIIDTYKKVSNQDNGKVIRVNGWLSKKEVTNTLKKEVVDSLF